MNYSKLVFVDLETTGANPAIDHITEIGLVEVDQQGQAKHWSSLVNPKTSIPAFIQGLTGITNDQISSIENEKNCHSNLSFQSTFINQLIQITEKIKFDLQ